MGTGEHVMSYRNGELLPPIGKILRITAKIELPILPPAQIAATSSPSPLLPERGSPCKEGEQPASFVMRDDRMDREAKCRLRNIIQILN